jgi:hypothetical protein
MIIKTGFFFPLLLLLVSCEAITGKPEIDLLEKAKEKVWESQAPRTTVYFNIPAGAGLTVPSGSGTAKQKIPFPVVFNQINGDYAFVQWAASRGRLETGLITQEELRARYGILEASEIFIQGAYKSSAEITVLGDLAEITLTPLLAVRPQVLDWRPDGGTSSPVVINTPLTARFSMNIRPSSFIWEYRNGEPGDTAYLIFSGYDAISGTDLHEVYITEKQAGQTVSAPRRFWYTEHSASELWADLVKAVEAAQPNLPGLYIMEYEIREGPEGLTELHLAAADAWGNVSASGAENSVYKLYRTSE